MSPVLGMVIGLGIPESQLMNNGLIIIANIEFGIPFGLDLIGGRIAHNYFAHDHLDFG